MDVQASQDPSYVGNAEGSTWMMLVKVQVWHHLPINSLPC